MLYTPEIRLTKLKIPIQLSYELHLASYGLRVFYSTQLATRNYFENQGSVKSSSPSRAAVVSLIGRDSPCHALKRKRKTSPGIAANVQKMKK